MARLQLRNLEKTYGNQFKAVHGINLDVEEGEFMVLVGPSGCAKSTTLRMIAGLETISGGEVRIGDRVVNDLAPGKRGIAMVFQNYALYPHMKVRSNLSFGLRIQNMPKAEREAATQEVARILEIEELLDRLPKQLSGGQAQRVALGRALIKKPEVFLFDEPLSNLDAKLRASMRVRIIDLHRRLKQEGKPATVVYVTHDQTEAMTMGDRICVMKEGRIMQVADPKTLYNRPANLFVAGFIGSPEMNLMQGRLEDVSDPVFRLGNQSVHLGRELGCRLAFAASSEATVGVRPQHFELVSADAGSGLNGCISHVEFMGHEVYLHVDLGGVKVIAVVGAADYEALDRSSGQLRLKPQAASVHVFDPASGENVSLAREAA
ncbi:ABC transporter ATP-binding protein [Roseibium litorale]|uniref:Sn-glycerol-3-phosphate ABC transporter ATP-binding protein UgpC n=1 Tax=Roseibium litorale TaxID=2803841 RepID=A0ABR9CKI4_9HYPH|nr:sn-glycerol-3-phosphate ABC transporter ATP-binding protein UgpC [Roseibium litorale]MBD8891174.1 sn-glycerol-3-phosphate ABC transporter ATP-binding protein UgpC [Roseibium litorale]